jgi:hypothetical protein
VSRAGTWPSGSTTRHLLNAVCRRYRAARLLLRHLRAHTLRAGPPRHATRMYPSNRAKGALGSPFSRGAVYPTPPHPKRLTARWSPALASTGPATSLTAPPTHTILHFIHPLPPCSAPQLLSPRLHATPEASTASSPPLQLLPLPL